METFCPTCGLKFYGHTSMLRGDKAAPRDGDASLCLHCGNWGIFINGPYGLGVRMPTIPERTVLMSDPRSQIIEHLVHAQLRQHPAGD